MLPWLSRCVVVLIILAPVSIFCEPLIQEYLWTHNLALDAEVEVKWIATDPYYLTMEMSAPTVGYVGIGFSPTGGMIGSDIAIGWVDSNGMPQLRDFHALENGSPVQDIQQDYELIAAEEKDNRTTVRFRRRWETCDEKHDMMIGNDTMRLIWAWHPEDPTVTATNSIAFKWHGTENRGVRSVYMRSPARPKNFPDDLPQEDPYVHNWDLSMKNVLVHGEKDNTYLCRIVKFPHLDAEHHMIGFRPIISEGNEEYVHHMSVYHCQVPEHLGGTKAVFDKFYNQEAGECYSPNMPMEWSKHCFTFLFTWAVGSEGEMFPEHVGSPLGGSNGESVYFKLEIHYDNPGRRTFLDSSGIRVFHTEVKRPYEATTLFIGHRTTPFQMIPYGVEKFTTYGFCGHECTENGINPITGMRAISVMLHAHLSGRKIRLRHVRKGKELPPIAEDNHYDFNYQQFRILNTEVVIIPGDELLVECEYETLKRDKFVFGGPDAEQEMCQAVLFYYPRSNLTDCRSQPEFYSFFKPLGIDNVTGEVLEKMQLPYDGNSPSPVDWSLIPPDNAYQLMESEDGGLENPFDLIKITRPGHMQNFSVGEHMRHMQWNENAITRKVESGWKNGLHYMFCGATGQRRIFTKEHAGRYPKFKEYKDPNKSSCRGRNKNRVASPHSQADHDLLPKTRLDPADSHESGNGNVASTQCCLGVEVLFLSFVFMTTMSKFLLH